MVEKPLAKSLPSQRVPSGATNTRSRSLIRRVMVVPEAALPGVSDHASVMSMPEDGSRSNEYSKP